MQLEKNTLRLFLSLVLSVILVNCASGPVTSVDPCVEIPFIDAPEGACTNTVNHKAYLVGAEEWKKMRPTMIMLRAEDWSKIKLDWLKACRMMINDGDKCNVAVSSVDTAVKQLDSIVKTVLGAK